MPINSCDSSLYNSTWNGTDFTPNDNCGKFDTDGFDSFKQCCGCGGGEIHFN